MQSHQHEREDGSLFDVEKALLQGLALRRCVRVTEAEKYFDRLIDAEITHTRQREVEKLNLERSRTRINLQLDALGMEVIKVAHKGEEYIGLSLKHEDEMWQANTPFTEKEIKFIKKIFDHLMEMKSYGRPASFHEIRNLRLNEKGGTIVPVTEAEGIFDYLKANKYIELNTENEVEMGPAAKIDLHEFIRSWVRSDGSESQQSTQSEGESMSPVRASASARAPHGYGEGPDDGEEEESREEEGEEEEERRKEAEKRRVKRRLIR
uniref:Non-structural maintenance of chromosomes element 1 homolog n=1 Tax=Palpitomonas bilix TaxID=652834 RepID=A0A7S3GG80_9EUKA|mmetsp:Transcript_47971/g.124560  ORF Transcript_47971/g.124560 Transcript_47971/m.124560 type:complete len:265 (+) Transcript_47971:341-1135(+)